MKISDHKFCVVGNDHDRMVVALIGIGMIHQPSIVLANCLIVSNPSKDDFSDLASVAVENNKRVLVVDSAHEAGIDGENIEWFTSLDELLAFLTPASKKAVLA